jgi:UDP-4-amino-4-deoxy-L-arabinose formyltransferase/UDP-glucuronic acid dehydrogenase (UDP-4-keto-hexauronic acid decarboxylating)
MAGAQPPPEGAFHLPGGGQVEAVATGFLTQEAGLAWVRALWADWLLCINSTAILPARLLGLFGERALNCHPGPLPEYAGLHVHQWAIRNGATEFGSTVHRMEARVDAGPIVAATRYPILESDTGLTLFRKAMADAARLLVSVLGRIAAGEALPAVPQDPARRRVYRHREALDGRIDWQHPARAVVDLVRAGNYEPFRSPSFTAAMTPPSGVPVEVLRCRIAGAAGLRPGSLLRLEEEGPVIACGDGNAVQILRARSEAGLLDTTQWRHHFG